MAARVKKASGEWEDFDYHKLVTSINRCGAPPEVAEEIARRVMAETGPKTSTKKIFRLAKKHLNAMHHSSGLRYSLKKALFRLGPTGYPFEKYIAAILAHYGYKTLTNQLIKGRCVTHEVDVIAENEKELLVIECKYHNTATRTSDVKTALYVQSRVEDLRPSFAATHPSVTYKGGLFTNTRLTEDAYEFANCAGLKTLGWRHPRGKGLEKLIEEKRLYPVTLLTGIKRGLAEKLVEHDIILLKDLMEMTAEEIASMLSLDARRARRIKRTADEMCDC